MTRTCGVGVLAACSTQRRTSEERTRRWLDKLWCLVPKVRGAKVSAWRREKDSPLSSSSITLGGCAKRGVE